MIKDLRDIEEIKKYVSEKLAKNLYSQENPANVASEIRFPSPSDYLTYIKNLRKQLGDTTIAEFVTKQTFLKSMNPNLGIGKLYNPAAVLGSPPGAGGVFTDFLEAPMASQNPGSENAKREDINLTLRKGLYQNIEKLGPSNSNLEIAAIRYEGKTLQQKIDEENLFSEQRPITENQYYQLDEEEDVFGTTTVVKNGVSYQVPDLSKRFEKKTGIAFKDGALKGGDFWKPKIGNAQSVSSNAAQKERIFRDQDTFFNAEDFANGYVLTQLGNEAYLPFYFQDLRKPDRFLYFRAFLSKFSENFSPNWNKQEFFGRTDKVGIYKNTDRSFSVSFKIMPLSPPGFSAAWRKVNLFTKLLYPQYKNGAMHASPLCRMRIGDVVCTSDNLGIPGLIENVSFDYSDSPWEMKSFTGPTEAIELGQAPMKIEVSFQFTVIHEENVGIDEEYNLNFGVVRKIGSVQDNRPEPFTLEDESSPTPEEL